MHAVTLLSALALAGSSLAAPVVQDRAVVVVTQLATVVVTAGEPEPTAGLIQAKAAEVVATTVATTVVESQNRPHRRPTRTADVVAAAAYTTVSSAAPYTPVYTAPAASTTAVVTTQPATTAAASYVQPTTSAAAPSSTAPASGSTTDYLSIANKWRLLMGLKGYTLDATLEENAKKTCIDGNGEMEHELNPGTMGQVLAPGGEEDFEKVFVGGWLCEVPATLGLNGICGTLSKGWTYEGQTGHNEILVSTKYTKIGCSLQKGIWGCDLA